MVIVCEESVQRSQAVLWLQYSCKDKPVYLAPTVLDGYFFV